MSVRDPLGQPYGCSPRSPGTHFAKCTYGVLCARVCPILYYSVVPCCVPMLRRSSRLAIRADDMWTGECMRARPAAQERPHRGRAEPRVAREPAAAAAADDESLGPEEHIAVESANKARGERGLGRPSAMAVMDTVAGVREKQPFRARSQQPLAPRVPRAARSSASRWRGEFVPCRKKIAHDPGSPQRP